MMKKFPEMNLENGTFVTRYGEQLSILRDHDHTYRDEFIRHTNLNVLGTTNTWSCLGDMYKNTPYLDTRFIMAENAVTRISFNDRFDATWIYNGTEFQLPKYAKEAWIPSFFGLSFQPEERLDTSLVVGFYEEFGYKAVVDVKEYLLLHEETIAQRFPDIWRNVRLHLITQ